MIEKEWLEAQEKARGVYRWLWWSPLLTVPTLAFFIFQLAFTKVSSGFLIWIMLFFSSLWHLFLLKWMEDLHPFVRWHGRQGFLLVGGRTLLALGTLISLTEGLDGYFLLLFLLIGVWFFGNRWGMRQVNEGTCWLMRWRAKEDDLEVIEQQKQESLAQSKAELIDQLLHHKNPQTRKRAALLLGEMTDPDQAVLDALSLARLDDHYDVRDAVRTTLQAPVYQADLQARKKPGDPVPPLLVFQPQANYETGLRLLEAGQRQDAVFRFVAAFRDGTQEIRALALAQLETLDEVETF